MAANSLRLQHDIRGGDNKLQITTDDPGGSTPEEETG